MNQKTTAKKKELELAEDVNQLPAENPSEIVTPMTMLKSARDNNATIEQMQQLMDMQFKWEANEARKAYFQAVADFKSVPVIITKDKVNAQYDSRYTSKGNLVNTVNVELSKHGLTARWSIDQEDGIKVACILSHSLGHSEEVSMTAPPDKSGSKNPIQEIKSTKTYLEIATFEAVTGVASIDDPGDTDGNLPPQLIGEEKEANLNSLIDEVGANKEQFLKMLKVEKLSALAASKYEGAVKRLQEKGKS